jgi:hypothetical protein
MAFNLNVRIVEELFGSQRITFGCSPRASFKVIVSATRLPNIIVSENRAPAAVPSRKAGTVLTRKSRLRFHFSLVSILHGQ